MKEWMERRTFHGTVFLLTALWSGLFAVMGFDVHHDGIMMVTALDVADGAVLFRETFAQYGILTPLLQGAALRLFGRELIVLRLLTALFYGGSAVMLDVVWKRFLSWKGRLLTWGMFLFLAPYLVVTFHPWSSVYALFTMLAAAEFALRGMEKRGGRPLLWWALCGAVAAATFGFRQPCGEVTMLAAGLALFLAWFSKNSTARETGKNLLALLAGCAVIMGSYALYLTFTQSWHDYLLQNFQFVSRFAWQRGGEGDYSRLSNAFFPLVTDDDSSYVIFGILPLMSLGLFWHGCRRVLRDRSSLQDSLPLLTLLLFALAGWHQYYPVPCIRHLYWGGAMMFGSFALILERVAKFPAEKKGKKILLLTLLILSLLPSVILRAAGALTRLPGLFSRQKIDAPTLHGMKLAKGEHALICKLQEFCKTMPPEIRERGVLNCTDDAYYTILLPETKFRHPMRQDWGGLVYQDYPEKRNGFVERNHPILLRKVQKDHSPEERETWNRSYRTLGGFNYMGELIVLEGPVPR